MSWHLVPAASVCLDGERVVAVLVDDFRADAADAALAGLGIVRTSPWTPKLTEARSPSGVVQASARGEPTTAWRVLGEELALRACRNAAAFGRRVDASALDPVLRDAAWQKTTLPAVSGTTARLVATAWADALSALRATKEPGAPAPGWSPSRL